ncbi:MAG: 2-amino-4-hydroxy-6-hydroxymethyldihydropteridine diphosphokinase [Armatimonadota bacterium]
MARVFISVGSNIDPEINILRALHLLSMQVDIEQISTFYRSEALGRPDQPQFYNGVVEVSTSIPPEELKYSVLRCIEDELDRKRTDDKYAPRTIDLDILLYDDLVIKTPDLTIPDPDIMIRPFLAVPLFELAPDIIISGTGMSIRQIMESLPEYGIIKEEEFSRRLREDFQHESR